MDLNENSIQVQKGDYELLKRWGDSIVDLCNQEFDLRTISDSVGDGKTLGAQEYFEYDVIDANSVEKIKHLIK